MKYDHISYLNTAERTSCADSSVCSHTRQALRGKETYGVLRIHFGSKIAEPAPLMSIYGITKWFKWTGDIMFALAQHTRMPTYPMALTFFFFFCMNLISTSAVSFLFTLLLGPCSSNPALFYPKFDSGWVISLVFPSSRLSLEDTQQWSQSLERLLESKCRFAFPLRWEF